MKNENMFVYKQIGETVWGCVGNLFTSAKCRGFRLHYGDVVTLLNLGYDKKRGYSERYVIGFTTIDGVSYERP